MTTPDDIDRALRAHYDRHALTAPQLERLRAIVETSCDVRAGSAPPPVGRAPHQWRRTLTAAAAVVAVAALAWMAPIAARHRAAALPAELVSDLAETHRAVSRPLADALFNSEYCDCVQIQDAERIPEGLMAPGTLVVSTEMCAVGPEHALRVTMLDVQHDLVTFYCFTRPDDPGRFAPGARRAGDVEITMWADGPDAWIARARDLPTSTRD